MDRTETLRWLTEEDPDALAPLWARADAVRRSHVGDAVHLRALVEISNHCVRGCAYCGIRAGNRTLSRYRMSREEIVACAAAAAALGFGTVVLQGGEDPGIGRDWLAGVVRRIKGETALAVTLSLGERAEEDLALWRKAGADRYLLRFETSDRSLYARLHPALHGRPSDRFALLRRLAALGYEVGSGVLVGLPGQSFASLADDLDAFTSLDLDMIGVGPFIPHPATPLGGRAAAALREGACVPATSLMACKVVALSRLACPEANIPATTALATSDPEGGLAAGLTRGANVVMPDLTPERYRVLYEIYPGKAPQRDSDVRRTVAGLGRTVATGPGLRRRCGR